MTFLKVTSAICLFLGTIIIVGDRIPPVRNVVDSTSHWQAVQNGLASLNSLDMVDTDGDSIGVLWFSEEGFDELLSILIDNRADLANMNVRAIVKTDGASLGEVPFTSIHVAYWGDNNTHGITFFWSFQDWVNDSYRGMYVFYGLQFVIVGFFLQLASLIMGGVIMEKLKVLIRRWYSRLVFACIIALLLFFIIPGLNLDQRISLFLTTTLVFTTIYYAHTVSRQKVYSVRPVLVIRESHQNGKLGDFPESCVTTHGTSLSRDQVHSYLVSKGQADSNSYSLKRVIEFYEYYIVNIGVGPALNIRIESNFSTIEHIDDSRDSTENTILIKRNADTQHPCTNEDKKLTPWPVSKAICLEASGPGNCEWIFQAMENLSTMSCGRIKIYYEDVFGNEFETFFKDGKHLLSPNS